MGLLLNNQVPTGSGELIHVETLPLKVETNPAFEEAKQLLEQMVASAGSLANSITNDADYNRAMKMMQGLKIFIKNVDEGIDPVKRRINDAKDRLMALAHELDVPAKNLQTALAKETGRYSLWKQEQVRLENERLERIAEQERQRKQREADLEALMTEIGAANQEADAATGRGQGDTANEIRAAIKPLVNKLKNAATVALIQNPVQEATGVRQVVALALQHEQARIAAAQAKAEGDKKAAAAILKASAKLEAPQVEEVYVAPVQATPTIARKPDLYKAPGASVRQDWRVKTIYDPGRVCREHPELCDPSESKINDLAKRLKAKPNVPGVEFELITKTIGVR